MKEEIEVNFRLDGNGRTIPTVEFDANMSTSNNDAPSPIQTYEPQSTMLEFSLPAKETDATADTLVQSDPLIDELLFDAEISDSGLMPRTFWMPSQGMEPRCHFEQMALDIFQHHVAVNSHYDPQSSGAEWWVQIRPSPEAGRYTMHAQNDNNGIMTQDMAKDGISFHWDKDEDLRILCGGNTYVHPHISTVTYLTDLGAPTMAFNIRVNQMTGDYIVPTMAAGDGKDGDNVQAFLSWPKFGKHLSFDGRFLHAAPSDVMEKGAFQKQCTIPSEDIPTGCTAEETKAKAADLKKLKRRHRRVTFLVNIWLNYKPFDVRPFPDTMINKLSGYGENESKIRLVAPKKGQADAADVHKNLKIDSSSTTQRFQWPMGDCSSKEFIEVDVPLDEARKEASSGGSLRLIFQHSNGVRLTIEDQAAISGEQDAESKATKHPATVSEKEEKQSKRPRTCD